MKRNKVLIQTLKIFCEVKEASNKRPLIIAFYLYEMSKRSKSIEIDNNNGPEMSLKEGYW